MKTLLFSLCCALPALSQPLIPNSFYLVEQRPYSRQIYEWRAPEDLVRYRQSGWQIGQQTAFWAITIADYATTRALLNKYPNASGEANPMIRCGRGLCEGRYWAISAATGIAIHYLHAKGFKRMESDHGGRTPTHRITKAKTGVKILKGIIWTWETGRTVIVARNTYMLVK